MKLTGPRLEQYQTVRAARAYLTDDVYTNAIKKIEAAQKRADAAAEAADKRAMLREAQREAAYAAKRKAAAIKAAATREARKQKFVYTYSADVTVREKRADGTWGPWFPMTTQGSITSTENKYKEELKKVLSVWIKNLEEESDIVVGEGWWETLPYAITDKQPFIATSVSASDVKMKDAGALALEGEESYDYDTGNGHCVFDWIIFRYGDVRGCKKVATMEGLTALFGEAALTDGVSCDDLVPFCEAVGCRMYALDETQRIIKTHIPDRINKNVPPLVFRVKNNHFYGIISEATSISKYGNGFVTEMAQVAEKDKVTADPIVELVELQHEEGGRVAQMVRICREAGIEVFNRDSSKVPINMDDDGLQSFVLQGRKYYWAHDETVLAAIRICELNGEAYTGQHIPGMLAEMMRELGYDKKSSLNPHVGNVLSQCKDRAHYGLLEGIDAIPEDAWACDIAKCYTACIENPAEPFMIFDVTCEWADWDGDLKSGLYFVITDDMTLLHASNVYSAAILQRAREEGIAFQIIRQLRPSKVLPVDYFAPLLAAIRKRCHNDAGLAKFFINILVGTLARTKLTRVFARMDTCADTVFRDHTATDKEGEPFLMAADGYYVYGRRVSKQISEHNLPMWIQILDASNIRLFDMIKASGGALIGRKTDCAVLVGGSIVESREIGGYRLCELPKNMRQMRPASMRELPSDLCDTPEWVYVPITSSSQVEEAWQTLSENAGMMIMGRAGTGKTFIAKKLAERFQGVVCKSAFTNKAALNIGGQTIHKMVKLDSKSKFNLKSLKARVGKAACLFIVDEISMIGPDMWRILCEVKKALPKSKFILLGDYRQLPPVGVDRDFFESSMVRFLAGGIRADLTEKQRYDQALWDLAEAINTDQPYEVRRGRIMTGRHLCHYNNTRMRINAMLNEKRGLFLAAGDEEGAQDTWVYPGLPVIATRNFSKGDDIYCVNSEAFTVISVGDRIRVASQRPEGEHIWDILPEEFHKYFVMNYATTVHRAQGETIEGPVTIWDWRGMDKRMLYTAVTRATKAENVWFA